MKTSTMDSVSDIKTISLSHGIFPQDVSRQRANKNRPASFRSIIRPFYNNSHYFDITIAYSRQAPVTEN